jgi:hypothetical protein
VTALRPWPCCWLALLVLLGCQRARRPVPTYSERVAPILERRCLPCHADTAGAAVVSPALATAEQAQRVAEQVALAVERRRMPPWGPDASGLCGRFVDAAWLGDAEISTLGAWARAGAPVGPALARASAAASSGQPNPFAWLLEPAPGERRLSLPARFTPGLGSGATRCFRSDAPPEGQWSIGALTVRAEPALSVQQLLVYALGDARQLEALQRLDGEDDEPGWSCYGGSGIAGSQLLASWSWLNPLQRLPAGSQLRATAGLPLVLQLRYNLIGAGLGPRPVQASAELVLHPAQRDARLQPLAVADLELPPGQRRAEASQELVLSEQLALHGVVPQLHGLGRSLLLERERAGQRTCLASFAHWNPAQQQLYRYSSAFDLEPGDRLRLACAYDTTSRSRPVLGGESIDQEQCRIQLYVRER